MASALKNLSQYDESTIPSAADRSFGIVVAEWNTAITHALFQGCWDTLIQHGAKEENLTVIQVPGSFELPTAARRLEIVSAADAPLASKNSTIVLL